VVKDTAASCGESANRRLSGTPDVVRIEMMNTDQSPPWQTEQWPTVDPGWRPTRDRPVKRPQARGAPAPGRSCGTRIVKRLFVPLWTAKQCWTVLRLWSGTVAEPFWLPRTVLSSGEQWYAAGLPRWQNPCRRVGREHL